jgi:hypothetical protein
MVSAFLSFLLASGRPTTVNQDDILFDSHEVHFLPFLKPRDRKICDGGDNGPLCDWALWGVHGCAIGIVYRRLVT